VHLVVSDDHEGITSALAGALQGAEWQRCVIHFEHNFLACHVPTSSMAQVAEEIKSSQAVTSGFELRATAKRVGP
jgi:putative transposase